MTINSSRCGWLLVAIVLVMLARWRRSRERLRISVNIVVPFLSVLVLGLGGARVVRALTRPLPWSVGRLIAQESRELRNGDGRRPRPRREWLRCNG